MVSCSLDFFPFLFYLSLIYLLVFNYSEICTNHVTRKLRDLFQIFFQFNGLFPLYLKHFNKQIYNTDPKI